MDASPIATGLPRRLGGAVLLSLAFHGLLIGSLKPVSAQFGGSTTLHAQLRPLATPAPSPGDAQLEPSRARPVAAAEAAGPSRAAAPVDPKLRKSYLERSQPRPGNLPDDRAAKVELDMALLTQYYTVREVDQRAELLEQVLVPDPGAELDPGRSGKVILLVLIGDDGSVDSTAVLEANPPGLFEASARAAFRTARYSPALKHGKPVKSQKVVEILYGR
jgi:protein TonB